MPKIYGGESSAADNGRALSGRAIVFNEIAVDAEGEAK